jgi:hypothetical protein
MRRLDGHPSFRSRAMTRSILGAALAAVLGCNPASAATPDPPAQATPSDAQLVASAEQAAPPQVASAATIVVPQADGTMRTVRPGRNQFTCMADNPTTPGPDPMCMDRSAMQWAGAWMGHKPPPAGNVGLMYMLAGGTDASNTDPYATAPSSGNHWVETGPHVMVVGADAAFYDQYPKTADPQTGAPYVMWAGTPYEHLMVPIK